MYLYIGSLHYEILVELMKHIVFVIYSNISFKTFLKLAKIVLFNFVQDVHIYIEDYVINNDGGVSKVSDHHLQEAGKGVKPTLLWAMVMHGKRPPGDIDGCRDVHSACDPKTKLSTMQ